MADDRRRDGSKLSFSERDKRRREGRDRRDRDDRGSRRGQPHAQKAYRAALERAFESGKVGELVATLNRTAEPRPAPPVAHAQPAADPPAGAEPSEPAAPAPRKRSSKGKRPPSPAAVRQELLAKIRGAEGGHEVTAAVDRFLAEFEQLPADYEVLEKALDHRKSEVVLRALEQLESALARSKPRRNRSLLMKLAMLEENHDDEDVCALAARVRALL